MDLQKITYDVMREQMGMANGGWVKRIAAIGDKVDSMLGMGGLPTQSKPAPKPQPAPVGQHQAMVHEQAVKDIRTRRQQELDAMKGMAKGGPTLGLIPGKVDPTVADDTTITTPSGAKFNAKIGEYVIPQEVVAALGTKFFDNLVLKEKKALGLPQEVGPKMAHEPDSMGRMDKMGLADGGQPWKPPYETDYTQLLKDNPISSVTTLGIAPAIAKLGGFAGNVVSAMGAETDPMAMVKGRTADVAGQLSTTTRNLATPVAGITQATTGQPVVGLAQVSPPPVLKPVVAPTRTAQGTPLGWQTGNGKTAMDFINDNPQTLPLPKPVAERPAYGITKDANGNPLLFGKGEPQATTQSANITPPQYQQSEMQGIPLRQAPQGRPGLSKSGLASFIDSTITDGNWMRNQADTERNQTANESLLDKARKDQIAQDANKNRFNDSIYGQQIGSETQRRGQDMTAETQKAQLGLQRELGVDKAERANTRLQEIQARAELDRETRAGAAAATAWQAVVANGGDEVQAASAAEAARANVLGSTIIPAVEGQEAEASLFGKGKPAVAARERQIIPKAPAGMRLVGKDKATGKPVYEDANGNRHF